MRTTLNIDNDLLLAVREIARRDSESMGRTVSHLLRQVLARDESDGTGRMDALAPFGMDEFGFRPFPPRGGNVTNELIERIREESGG